MPAYIFIDTNGEADPRRVVATGIDEAWRKYIADILWPSTYRGSKTYEDLREEAGHSTLVIFESDIRQVS